MHSTTKFLYLWKSAVVEKSFKFLAADKLPTFGLSSVYAVPEDTANRMLSEQNYYGYKGEVWSPALWIDVDSYELAEKVKERLLNEHIAFDVYDSGSKGCHFRIVRRHTPSNLLPIKDKQWVEKFAPEADLTLYSHLHLLRLPGARHEKSGRHKVLLSQHEGRSLDFEGMAAKEPEIRTVSIEKNAEGSIFDNFYIMSLTTPAPIGKRHDRLLKTTRGLFNHGKSPQFALEWLIEVNKRFKEQKTEAELERIVNFIYGNSSSEY